MELYLAQIKLNGSDDDHHTLMVMGAALVRYWDDLPIQVREDIYTIAISGRILGLPQVGPLKRQVDALLTRNAPEADCTSLAIASEVVPTPT